jgi:nicotinamide mononucleotide adenylyltransferase
MINYNKPTAMMLGRWQPWHQGHQMLFEKSLEKTGQVIIMVRDTPRDDSNPFDFSTMSKTELKKHYLTILENLKLLKYPTLLIYVTEEEWVIKLKK